VNARERALFAARPDLAAVARWVAPGARVLDLGCGDGALLRYLWEAKGVPGYGVEIDSSHVVECLKNDVNVLQMNLEDGLAAFGDRSFDCVILSETIQAIRHTEQLMREMLRVGEETIVSFPNFGHWRARLQVALGRMPVSPELPYQWYDTPNVHLCTLEDFEDFCRCVGFRVLERLVLHTGRGVRVLPNLFGSLAAYRLGRGNAR
jgi:methionine biosynthesis protein MetW